MINLEERIRQAYENKRRVSPVRSNRASQLGHPCERHLVYWRLNWEQAKLPSVETLFLWEGGRAIEQLALSRLQEAGFTILQQQRDFEDKNTGITGHIDGMLCDPDEPTILYPIEIKGINQFDWEKINTPEDMLASDKPWMQAYPAQLQLYLYLSNHEEGLFYIVNKTSLQGKDIWMTLDYAYVEKLLQKAERINQYVAEGKYPDRIEYDENICGRCPFLHLCLPDVIYDPLALLDDEVIEQKLNRRAELKAQIEPLEKELRQIEKELKAYFEGKEKVLIGNWIITGKWVERKEYTVPASRYWQIKYQRVPEEG